MSPAKKKNEMAEGEGEGERSLSCGGCTILEWERLEATIPNKNPQAAADTSRSAGPDWPFGFF